MNVSKIKKSDYVVCIRNYQDFTKNKLYKVRDVFEDGYILLINDSTHIYTGFELLEDKSNRYFFNYFTTQQDYRKTKLEKINEINESR